jgi:transcriptional regulator with XRE-family HTH domain
MKNRDIEIKEIRKKNVLTLEQIGSKYGITGERVRQIITGDERKERYGKIQKEYTRHIQRIIDDHLLEEIERLSKPDRTKELVMQRSGLIKVLHDKYGFNFSQLGTLFQRDHKTISNLYKKYEKYYK